MNFSAGSQEREQLRVRSYVSVKIVLGSYVGIKPVVELHKYKDVSG